MIGGRNAAKAKQYQLMHVAHAISRERLRFAEYPAIEYATAAASKCRAERYYTAVADWSLPPGDPRETFRPHRSHRHRPPRSEA